MNKKNDVIVMGLALFAMFFGAGNLLFPPSLGLYAGKAYLLCGLGFFVTAIGMPLLGIIAGAKVGGNVYDIGNKVGKKFSKIFATVIVLTIGPLLAIPRTGATTYEMGIQPLFPMVPEIIGALIFFGLTLYLTIKPSKVVDNIGKILTPVLLLVIGIIIVKGIATPLGSPTARMSEVAFTKGFTEGYQTVDALASLLFGIVIIRSIKDRGYTSLDDQINLSIKSGIIAACGLVFVYGGLIYIGASVNGIYDVNTEKSLLLINITTSLLQGSGKIILSIVVSLACLTTSIGLTATVGDFFEELTNKKVSYKTVVIITCLFSAYFSIMGVDSIVKIAVPLLELVYPISIVLILLASIDEYVPSKFYVGSVIGCFIISFNSCLIKLNITIDLLNNFSNFMPLSTYGFPWILPSIVGGIISTLLLKSSTKNNKKIA